MILKNRGKSLFDNLEIGKLGMTENAFSFLILRFDFSGLDTSSFDAFEMSLNFKINDIIKEFIIRYDIKIEINEDDSISSFQRLQSQIRLEGKKIYILVDEYDSSINSALGNKELTSRLRVNDEFSRPIKQIESKFKLIFSRFKEALQNPNVRIFITGVTPLVLTEFTSGFNVAFDITTDFRFDELYGFREEQVRDGLNNLKLLNNSMKDEIIRIWRAKDNGYRFSHEQKNALFNPTKILYSLNYTQVNSNLYPKETDITKLLKFREDKNSKPSEAVLRIVAKESKSKEILEDFIVSEQESLLNEKFTLSDLENIAERNNLISYLFYNGGVTFSKKDSWPVEIFKIPNQTAKKEFIDEIVKQRN